MNFVEKCQAEYDLVEEPAYTDEAIWSCYGYEDSSVDELHCTHKYFGPQPPENIKQIIEITDLHFKEFPFKPFTVVFDKEEMFGEDSDVRVLTRDEEKYPIDIFHMDLRGDLDNFAKDNFPNYEPHVTTDANLIGSPFTKYCICQGDKILAEYKAEEAANINAE